jgi:hypothetical protein
MKTALVLLSLLLFPLPVPAGPIGSPLRLDFLSPTTECYVEPFMPSASNVLGWTSFTHGSGPVVGRLSGEPHHPGLLSFSTHAAPAIGQGGSYALSSGPEFTTGGLATATNWFAAFIWRLRQTADIRARVGFFGTVTTAPPTTGLWVRYDTHVSFADSQFVLECLDSASSSIPTGVPADATTLHHFSVYPTAAGTVAVSVDGGAPVSVSSNCPAGGLTPGFQVLTNVAGQKGLDLDYFLFCQTNLAR